MTFALELHPATAGSVGTLLCQTVAASAILNGPNGERQRNFFFGA